MRKLLSACALMLAMKTGFAQEKDSLPCLPIVLEGPRDGEVYDGQEAVVYVKSFGKAFKKHRFQYKWVVSNGTITRGQGTNTIYISTKGLKGEKLSVAVEVGSLKADCPALATTTIEVKEARVIQTTQTISSKPIRN